MCPAMHSPRYASQGASGKLVPRGIYSFILHNEIAFFGTLSVASAVSDLLRFGSFPLTRQRASSDHIIAHLLREALGRNDVPRDLLIWAIYTQTSLAVSSSFGLRVVGQRLNRC